MASSQEEKNAATAWSFFRSKGLSESSTAGILGNLSQESNINWNEPGGLVAQWGGARLAAEQSYANSIGVPYNSPSAELGYLWNEIQAGNQKAPGGQYVTPGSLNAQGSPASAALFFSDNFERPAPWAANNANRENMANHYYQEFTGQTAPAGALPISQMSASSGGTQAPSSQSPNGFPSGSDIIGIIDQSLSLQGFDILHPGKSLAQDAGAIALRTVLVIVGLILFIFGLVAIVERVAPGTPVPVPV